MKLLIDLLAGMGHSGSKFGMGTVLNFEKGSDPLGRITKHGRLITEKFIDTCPMCLGANEFISDDHFIKEVTQRVVAEGHEIHDFKI